MSQATPANVLVPKLDVHLLCSVPPFNELSPICEKNRTQRHLLYDVSLPASAPHGSKLLLLRSPQAAGLTWVPSARQSVHIYLHKGSGVGNRISRWE